MKPRRPAITRSTVADPDQLGTVIDTLVLGDPELQCLHRRAVRQVRHLRGVLDGNQWAKFMAVEETLNGRWARSLTLVARAFFEAGLRSGRRRGRRR